MAGFPKALMWQRIDGAGAEQTLLSDASGLHARGTQLGTDPLPYTCRYELYTDDAWTTVHFETSVEGPGFVRTAKLERAAGRWRVTASEQGDLDAALVRGGRAGAGMPGSEDSDQLARALDLDLAFSPLTNTLPVRRLGLLDAPAGRTYEIEVAFVRLPSLEIVHSVQSYTATGGPTVHFVSGSFVADITLDAHGYVTHYPGLAQRV